ncbi:MAG TPA: DNA topoisomerase [Leptolyngbya sp.]|jgi:DNA topoisomerase-1|nr:DNA topoisomerase [Leptolyngbya sp.]
MAPNVTRRKLLIIEAPGKLKKLRAILGSEYEVRASGGHIRELANDDAESLGFEFIHDRVHCRWSPRDPKAKSTIADLKSAVKQASTVILATDEDREGETIAWHLAQALNLKDPKRITYREITESAVRTAIANPRLIDQNLVNAGICRSVLDKLVGYRGSPLLWKLNAGAKSVGRVQSAALHLIVEREQKITDFNPQDYWNVFVHYAEGFRAYYAQSQSNPEVEQNDDAADPSDRQESESDQITSRREADRLVLIAQSQPHQGRSIEGKTVTRTPPAAFTTSTLQQAAGAKLKLSLARTMELAQKLYEQGHITYHRTDATFLSSEFCELVRQWLAIHDAENLPQKTTQHRSSKNAQEAHEAIRPTHINRSSAALQAELRLI